MQSLLLDKKNLKTANQSGFSFQNKLDNANSQSPTFPYL
ncbi:hypothetical protein CHRYSEO8AT_490001 [Chryseobacterium sp. 8AT]|nr:hypothetical protein CHRYSEO8AT_490001 [Chryseobacterium sp. 8AT]